jgi:UDP-glucose 4-epimerase
MGEMLDPGVDCIVFSSSCAPYGNLESMPILETGPQRPINPYGGTKLRVEKALKWYGEAFALRFVTLRYFNAAGADKDGDLGEEHDPETHVIQAGHGRTLRQEFSFPHIWH